MNFFGLGPMEILLILIVALIVFGPGRLPELASGLGRAIREFRKVSTELTRDLTRDIAGETKADATEKGKTNSEPLETKKEEEGKEGDVG